jgi:hypothetical protein
MYKWAGSGKNLNFYTTNENKISKWFSNLTNSHQYRDTGRTKSITHLGFTTKASDNNYIERRLMRSQVMKFVRL